MLADPNQMRQVLWNLLTNAAEAVTGSGASTSRRSPPAIAAR